MVAITRPAAELLDQKIMLFIQSANVMFCLSAPSFTSLMSLSVAVPWRKLTVPSAATVNMVFSCGNLPGYRTSRAGKSGKVRQICGPQTSPMTWKTACGVTVELAILAANISRRTRNLSSNAAYIAAILPRLPT